MRILITNDDGINAPGLEALAEIAAEIAGPDGEVWTVAPAFEQSGVGHCISYAHPTLIAELAPRRWAAEGSPADCVLAAIGDIMADAPPDLILSGVNRGNNAGENVMYSGTIGAAMEGALQGIPSIALSQYLGAATARLTDPFDCARVHGARVVRALLDRGTWAAEDDFALFYNVNFPPVGGGGMRGIRVAPQGRRSGVRFGVHPHVAPNGRRFLWVGGGPQTAPATPGSDVEALMAGYTTITPMRPDLTCRAATEALAGDLDEG
ncbi:5'/3'-nucleotidase SurE [Paracoccus sphaerophysae]|uniref:5'/3'-nucleotidase SurE n=1 Tax=Paracoccus sphaerophysae TaxID=690417 RepID=UPI002356DB46|nr:5'/3'-nucleotidase SurE [Paracoccus sphaerophysae]